MSKEYLTFKEALLKIYLEQPCKVLPNAIWKTLPLLEDLEQTFNFDGEEITSLKLWDKDSLHIYWTRERTELDLSEDYMRNIDFMLIHSDYIDNVPVETFESKKSYFRMKHSLKDVEQSQIPEGFSINDVDPETEADKVSTFIGECYENIHPSTETVESWSEKTVFDEESWIWIIDVERDKKAALGIAEFDERVSEISLEWIQVHPEYRVKGIGRILVNELLYRAQGKADFATVAGEYGTDNSPKSFYERCGFEGDDIWFVLRNEK